MENTCSVKTCSYKIPVLFYTLRQISDKFIDGSFVFNFSTPTISTPEEVIPSTPAKAEASDFGTNLFVIGLLVVSLVVLIALALYARKIFNER